MKKRSLLVSALFCVGLRFLALAQNQDVQDPQIRQFELISNLLREDRPREAESLLQQAQLSSHQTTFQIGDLTLNAYTFSFTLLINTYLRLYDYASAERAAQDRVKWTEQHYGAASRQEGGIIALLAEVDRQQGKYKEAEPLYLRALSLFRSFDLANCLTAKEIYTGLAETYLALGRPSDAETLLSPAIHACQEKFGAKGVGRANLLNAYAVALERDKQPEEAARASAEADRVGVIDARFQEEERDLLRGRLEAAQGQFDAAILSCRKWISILEVPDRPDSDRRLMLPLGECERLSRLAGRQQEAANFGARLKAIETKYDVHF